MPCGLSALGSAFLKKRELLSRHLLIRLNLTFRMYILLFWLFPVLVWKRLSFWIQSGIYRFFYRSKYQYWYSKKSVFKIENNMIDSWGWYSFILQWSISFCLSHCVLIKSENTGTADYSDWLKMFHVKHFWWSFHDPSLFIGTLYWMTFIEATKNHHCVQFHNFFGFLDLWNLVIKFSKRKEYAL